MKLEARQHERSQEGEWWYKAWSARQGCHSDGEKIRMKGSSAVIAVCPLLCLFALWRLIPDLSEVKQAGAASPRPSASRPRSDRPHRRHGLEPGDYRRRKEGSYYEICWGQGPQTSVFLVYGSCWVSSRARRFSWPSKMQQQRRFCRHLLTSTQSFETCPYYNLNFGFHMKQFAHWSINTYFPQTRDKSITVGFL